MSFRVLVVDAPDEYEMTGCGCTVLLRSPSGLLMTELHAVELGGEGTLLTSRSGAPSFEIVERGTSGTVACAGDDSRLSDAREPLPHTHPLADITDAGDLAALDTVGTAQIDADSVTYAKLQNVTDARLLGRSAGSSGDAQEITIGANLTLSAGELSASGGGVSDGDKGDVTVSGSGATWTIDPNVISDSKLRDSAACSVIGRAANSSGDPADIAAGANDRVLARRSDALSFEQIQIAMIADGAVTYAKIQDVSATDRFLGRKTSGAGDVEELTGTEATARLDAFTSGAKGLAPASGGGTTNFLRADGTWAEPAGGGGGLSQAQVLARGLGA